MLAYATLLLLASLVAATTTEMATVEIVVDPSPPPPTRPFKPHPSHRLFNRHRLFVGGAPPNPENKPLPPDQWFVQRLDHFQPTDERVWKQRYWINEEFYRPGGPVFLMIGGEGKENPIWMVEGTWIEYAKAFGAKCFMLEHR